MAKVTGIDRHLKRLKSAQDVAQQVTAALYLGGQTIELDAEISIIEGSTSGAGHVPSLPGQPPNRDTGDLDRNIETTVEAHSPPTVHVTSHMPYSASLEFGTSKMAERPYMRPATEKNRKKVTRQVADAVKIAVRRG